MRPGLAFLRQLGNRSFSSWLLAAALLSLLLILAGLQYRWLEEVSEANRKKSQDLLQTAVTRFAEDFDRELTRAFLYLLPPHLIFASFRQDDSLDAEGFARRYERWQTSAPFPELVREVFLVRRSEDGRLETSRLDLEAGEFKATDWPKELEPLHLRLAEHRWPPRRRGESRDRGPTISVLAADVPALVLPLADVRRLGGRPPGRRSGDRPFRGRPHRGRHSSPEELDARRPSTPPEAERSPNRKSEDSRYLESDRRGPPPSLAAIDFVVLWLDLETIHDTLLPRLSQQHLRAGAGIPSGGAPSGGTQYTAQVWTASDPQPIFATGVRGKGLQALATEGQAVEGDASIDFFKLLPPEKLGTLAFEVGLGDELGLGQEATPEQTSGSRHRGGPLHRLYHFLSLGVGDPSSSESGRGGWRLVVSHPAGSLEAAVHRAHRRNLAISFGILLVLGASLLLMLLSTRRIQALARQQLEFVAGVTHELLTPLAAVRSAGQNLADGVVARPEQVQRYGRLIEDEGRRLSTMVEQALEFAGIQAGRKSYALERTHLAPIVDSALAEYQGVLDEQGVRLDKHLEEDLPEILADAAALRRAVQNLIANAAKYGVDGGDSNGPWIGLRAVAVDGNGGYSSSRPGSTRHSSSRPGNRGQELQLSIEDKGPGIAAADLPRLFDPFYRGRNGSSNGVPGSGLGLALVQHIAEGHGGRVTVTSEEGTGTTFTLHLPTAEPLDDELLGDDPLDDEPTPNDANPDQP